MRRLALAALLVGIATLGAACSSGTPVVPAASAAPTESLVFTGPLAGKLTSGIQPLQFSNAEPSQASDDTVTHTACASFDVKDNTGMDFGNTYEIAIYGMVENHPTSLVVTLDSEITPSGTVPFTGKANQGAMASLNAKGTAVSGLDYVSSDADSSIVFDPGSKSGSIRLYASDRPFGSTVESVVGTWRCP